MTLDYEIEGSEFVFTVPEGFPVGDATIFVEFLSEFGPNRILGTTDAIFITDKKVEDYIDSSFVGGSEFFFKEKGLLQELQDGVS